MVCIFVTSEINTWWLLVAASCLSGWDTSLVPCPWSDHYIYIYQRLHIPSLWAFHSLPSKHHLQDVRQDTVAEIKNFVNEKMSIPGEQMLFICKGTSPPIGWVVWLALSTTRELGRFDSACGKRHFVQIADQISMSHPSCQGNLWRMVARCRRWICNLETRRSSNVFSIEMFQAWRNQQSVPCPCYWSVARCPEIMTNLCTFKCTSMNLDLRVSFKSHSHRDMCFGWSQFSRL